MKQTMALMDFMMATGTSLIEAVGLIDQLHEMEKAGKIIADLPETYFSTYFRESLKRVRSMELSKNYIQFKLSHAAEQKSDWNKNYSKKKKLLKERERSAPSSPFLPPTPPNIPPISPEERERNHDDDDNARARVETVETYAAGNLQHMSAGNLDDLAGYMELLPEELIRFAIDTACANGAPRWAYVSAILQGYVRDGIKTVGDAKAAREKAKKVGSAKPNQALDYKQREYDAEEYGDRFYVDLEKLYSEEA